MSLILNIDTAQENAFVSIAENGKSIHQLENNNQKDHAAFLHTAIKNLLDENKIDINSIDAIAVTKGPGSYTGIRVGLSAAKGICYSLQKPLIAINTLELMAFNMIENAGNMDYLYCPMIDARRMEVFTAIYDNLSNIIMTADAMILNPQSFEIFLNNKAVIFAGSGAPKFQNIIDNANAKFIDINDLHQTMSDFSYLKFQSATFDDWVTTDPLYLKEYKAF